MIVPRWRKIAAERSRNARLGIVNDRARSLFREAQLRGVLLALPGRSVVTVIDLPTLLRALGSVCSTHWPPPCASS